MDNYWILIINPPSVHLVTIFCKLHFNHHMSIYAYAYGVFDLNLTPVLALASSLLFLDSHFVLYSHFLTLFHPLDLFSCTSPLAFVSFHFFPYTCSLTLVSLNSLSYMHFPHTHSLKCVPLYFCQALA